MPLPCKEVGVFKSDTANSGMHLLYLPPYSPDLDPIEEGFSATKAWLRRNQDYARGELTGHADCDPYTMLWDAVFESMTPDNIAGWFSHSAYIP
jgi:hypothetical protein